MPGYKSTDTRERPSIELLQTSWVLYPKESVTRLKHDLAITQKPKSKRSPEFWRPF
jgi:hypothetical protein